MSFLVNLSGMSLSMHFIDFSFAAQSAKQMVLHFIPAATRAHRRYLNGRVSIYTPRPVFVLLCETVIQFWGRFLPCGKGECFFLTVVSLLLPVENYCCRRPVCHDGNVHFYLLKRRTLRPAIKQFVSAEIPHELFFLTIRRYNQFYLDTSFSQWQQELLFLFSSIVICSFDPWFSIVL